MSTRNQSGVSFMETMMATAVFMVIAAGVLTVVSNAHRSYANERSGQDLTWQGRAAVDVMVRDLRAAGYPAKNTYAASAALTPANSNLVATTFVTAGSTQVVFEGDVDGDGIVERVEYRLSGTTLQRSAVAKNSDGSIPTAHYDDLASNVSNGTTAIFTYTSDPLSALAAPGNTACVQIALTLKSAVPDPKNGSYGKQTFRGLACRQNPDH